jgi:hypothetical protein
MAIPPDLNPSYSEPMPHPYHPPLKFDIFKRLIPVTYRTPKEGNHPYIESLLTPLIRTVEP